MPRLTVAGKIALLLLFLGVVIGGYQLVTKSAGGGGFMEKIAPSAKTKEAVVPKVGELPTMPEAGGSTPEGEASLASTGLPSSDPGCTDKPEVRMLGYAWNAHMGLMYAIGGPQATAGSVMCKNGVNLKWERQDDNSKLQEGLVAFATELSRGTAQPTRGVHFVTVMGDGSAYFLAGLNKALRRIGPEYTAKVIGACGFSRGEDKFMGPAEWAQNPAASRGGVVAGVLRDGDWNIGQKWLADNGLKTNPDEKTWDPDALNWIAANDYIDAAEKYITGYTEKRPVVRNGKRTGETKTIKVDGVVTWTPGDVTIAQKKGGLVSIVSTKEYSAQMPCVIIGIDRWMKQNRPTVEGLLQAIGEGGDAVRKSPQALRRASTVAAALFHESGADAAYWEKYFKGVAEPDKTGEIVELGGSSVNNVADSMLTFGLVPGSANLYAATYKVFGDVVSQQYPDELPSYPPLEQILDTSYLQAVGKRNTTDTRVAVAKVKPVFRKAPKVNKVVSRRAWKIEFETGRATFTPASQKNLNRMLQDLLVAQGARVEIHGHTDNVGNPTTNMSLSEARAFAVKNWLEKKAPINFPANRVQVFAHGSQNPIAPNTSNIGRAQNRRVEIVLGT